MFIKSTLIVILLLFGSVVFSQYDIEKSSKDSTSRQKTDNVISALKKNTYVGSGINLLLGNQLFLYASPQIGYEFLPNFSAGILSSIQYNKIPNYSETALGIGLFSRYILLKKVIFESSFNLYRIRGSASGQLTPFEIRSKSWLAGLGYARSLGDRSYAHFLVSYDLLREPNNPELGITLFSNFRLYYKFGITIYPFK